MTDKISNTYHSAMGATKETLGKIVHNEHLMNSGKAERAQANARSGKHTAAGEDIASRAQTETTVTGTPAANTQSAAQRTQDENSRLATEEHLAFM
ncbi:hypothetical protein BG006_003133 [Podila minutissima]|uniref:Uncharacterized protein n=1 Tax=Podila minutissima TaxID=64525 RepID=A0A9P5SMJ4_9FUNG|nr:hypothetical protein BG006_003133 [Podila minutissima]